jgi:hypothetical protein
VSYHDAKWNIAIQGEQAQTVELANPMQMATFFILRQYQKDLLLWPIGANWGITNI